MNLRHTSLAARGAVVKAKNRKATIPASRPIEKLEGRLLFSTYFVTGTADGPGTVTPIFGNFFTATTLRGAIGAANAHAGKDAVVISPFVSGIIALDANLGQLDVTDDVTIQGFGARRQSVDGGGAIR